jgi:hypothetical protein
LSRHHERQEYVRQLAAAGAVIYRNNYIDVSAIQRSTQQDTLNSILQICYNAGKCDAVICRYATMQVSVTSYSADMLQCR